MIYIYSLASLLWWGHSRGPLAQPWLGLASLLWWGHNRGPLAQPWLGLYLGCLVLDQRLEALGHVLRVHRLTTRINFSGCATHSLEAGFTQELTTFTDGT